jgi:D-psicose/D-tagatose/L-ribulose 3-epimerase
LKYSISNLSWGKTSLDEVIPRLSIAGLQGIEIAPTAIWPDLEILSDHEIVEFKRHLKSHGLVVSGIQSLLYGHPELQLFDYSCWKDLQRHLEKVIRIGGLLEASVAVFGSPKNRIKGNLNVSEANELASTFLRKLNPCLKENNIVLTLEPNAPDYGADYLTNYEEVTYLSKKINSSNIKPQIDTGCLWMVDSIPEEAYVSLKPHHIHLSTPNLEEVPGTYHFDKLLQLTQSSNYEGWLVIEMLGKGSNPLFQVMNSIRWLTSYKEGL